MQTAFIKQHTKTFKHYRNQEQAYRDCTLGAGSALIIIMFVALFF